MRCACFFHLAACNTFTTQKGSKGRPLCISGQMPVPQGEDKSVEDSTNVTVETGLSIVASPVPGIATQPSSFNLTGAGIALNATCNWDFGKNEGGMGTEKPDAKATHTYQQAGTYTVTATAIDLVSGKTLGNPTLQYKVIAQPYVKIDPRPSSAKVGDKINLTAKLYNMPDKPEDLMEAPLYSWIISKDDIQEAWPKGEDVSYTINGPGLWTIMLSVETKDKNRKWIRSPEGNTQLIDSIAIQVGGALSLNIPAEVTAGKGITGKKYDFSVTSNILENGKAEYIWYSNGQVVIRGTDKKSTTASFAKARDYTMKVEANWTDSSGNQQTASSQEVSFNINDTGTVTLNIPDAIGAGKGVTGQKYGFSVTTKNVPDGAEYVWYSNGQVVIRGTDKKSTTASFAKARDYTMKVEANWKDENGQSQTISSDPVTFQIGELPQEGSITIVPPPDIVAGKGVIKTKYIFTADSENIPDGAEYVWYSNGQVVTSGTDKKSTTASFAKARDYTMKVEANWTDSSGNQQTAISKEVSFNINDTSSQQGSGGEGVICLFTADKPSMGDVIGISIFQNGRTVIDNQTGTEGLGSNKFKLTPGHYTVKVAGRCGYLLPFAGNTKDAFTYDPPKTTSCEIDVVGGSSTAEFHYPWSCP